MSEQALPALPENSPPAPANQPEPPEEAHQAKLRERYLEQQRRMRCVGCGEVDEYF